MDIKTQHIQLSSPAFKIYTDGSAEYKVEKIIGHHRKSRGHEFRVHWKGYNKSEDAWLTTIQLKNAKQLLDNYKRIQGLL